MIETPPNQDDRMDEDDLLQVTDSQDEDVANETSLLAPVNYFDPEGRIAAATLLGDLAQVLPDNQDPCLPGGFCLPGQVVVITGMDCPLLDAPQGEGMTTLDAEHVLAHVWYGSSEQADLAIELLVEHVLNQHRNSEDRLEPIGTQHLIAKWLHPDIDRAILGVFLVGDGDFELPVETINSETGLVLLQDDQEPASPFLSGDAISGLGLGADEQAGAIDLLMTIAVEDEDRIDLFGLLEERHPAALAIRMDDHLRHEWMARLSRHPL